MTFLLPKRLSLLFALPTLFLSAFGKEPPNVILFIADDVSWNDFGCYGNTGARTPHIDALASNGLTFNQAFLTASSCSPSRASIITGRYPHNNGKAAELHLPIADHLPWLPEVLREKGYYTALSGKYHMSRTQKPDTDPFDHIDLGKTKGQPGGEANWLALTHDRPADTPFFFWFASYDAHRGWDDQWLPDRYGPRANPAQVIVPPFLLDTPETRADLAAYYDEVTRFDHYIGEVVKELKRQNALENTLIFVLADNGRPFPRAKTRLHDSGMKTALVAHWPAGIRDRGETESLVSVIDLAPTIIELAGAKPGPTFQGLSLSSIFKDKSKSPRQHAFSEHNWHDYEALGRSVRWENFLYIENHRPELALQGPADSVRSPSFQQLLAARKADTLTPAQQDVFQTPRAATELYDSAKDPHQLNNLAQNPEYAKIRKRLAKKLNQWKRQTGDSDPAKISTDEFHRETGLRIVPRGSFRHETPGESENAAQINHPGPR